MHGIFRSLGFPKKCSQHSHSHTEACMQTCNKPYQSKQKAFIVKCPTLKHTVTHYELSTFHRCMDQTHFGEHLDLHLRQPTVSFTHNSVTHKKMATPDAHRFSICTLARISSCRTQMHCKF